MSRLFQNRWLWIGWVSGVFGWRDAFQIQVTLFPGREYQWRRKP